tara:strand:- start:4800 stop:4985 length:186 start_codon:yes stop_codon:yes gene_type:complete
MPARATCNGTFQQSITTNRAYVQESRRALSGPKKEVHQRKISVVLERLRRSTANVFARSRR